MWKPTLSRRDGRDAPDRRRKKERSTKSRKQDEGAWEDVSSPESARPGTASSRRTVERERHGWQSSGHQPVSQRTEASYLSDDQPESTYHDASSVVDPPRRRSPSLPPYRPRQSNDHARSGSSPPGTRPRTPLPYPMHPHDNRHPNPSPRQYVPPGAFPPEQPTPITPHQQQYHPPPDRQFSLPAYATGYHSEPHPQPAYLPYRPGHRHHGSAAHYPSSGRHSSVPYRQKPSSLSKWKTGLLNLISDPDEVRKMEEYTEYIGVCKNCFDPHSSPLSGPREHRYVKRRSRESLRRSSSESLRVDKRGRYRSSSREEKIDRRRATYNVVRRGSWSSGHGSPPRRKPSPGRKSSPRLTTRRNSSSSSSSSTRSPGLTSILGLRKSPTQRKKSRGFFTFNNSSSSGSDMAYGEPIRPLRKKKSAIRVRKSSGEKIAETVAGINATAAALKSARRPRRKVVDLKDPRVRMTREDDDWVDESDSDSGLAFGEWQWDQQKEKAAMPGSWKDVPGRHASQPVRYARVERPEMKKRDSEPVNSSPLKTEWRDASEGISTVTPVKTEVKRGKERVRNTPERRPSPVIADLMERYESHPLGQGWVDDLPPLPVSPLGLESPMTVRVGGVSPRLGDEFGDEADDIRRAVSPTIQASPAATSPGLHSVREEDPPAVLPELPTSPSILDDDPPIVLPEDLEVENSQGLSTHLVKKLPPTTLESPTQPMLPPPETLPSSPPTLSPFPESSTKLPSTPNLDTLPILPSSRPGSPPKPPPTPILSTLPSLPDSRPESPTALPPSPNLSTLPPLPISQPSSPTALPLDPYSPTALPRQTRNISSTAIPLRFPFGPSSPTRSSAGIPTPSPGLPPKVRRAHSLSRELKPLYLVERTLGGGEAEGEGLPSLPSSRSVSEDVSIHHDVNEPEDVVGGVKDVDSTRSSHSGKRISGGVSEPVSENVRDAKPTSKDFSEPTIEGYMESESEEWHSAASSPSPTASDDAFAKIKEAIERRRAAFGQAATLTAIDTSVRHGRGESEDRTPRASTFFEREELASPRGGAPLNDGLDAPLDTALDVPRLDASTIDAPQNDLGGEDTPLPTSSNTDPPPENDPPTAQDPPRDDSRLGPKHGRRTHRPRPTSEPEYWTWEDYYRDIDRERRASAIGLPAYEQAGDVGREEKIPADVKVRETESLDHDMSSLKVGSPIEGGMSVDEVPAVEVKRPREAMEMKTPIVEEILEVSAVETPIEEMSTLKVERSGGSLEGETPGVSDEMLEARKGVETPVVPEEPQIETTATREELKTESPVRSGESMEGDVVDETPVVEEASTSKAESPIEGLKLGTLTVVDETPETSTLEAELPVRSETPIVLDETPVVSNEAATWAADSVGEPLRAETPIAVEETPVLLEEASIPIMIAKSPVMIDQTSTLRAESPDNALKVETPILVDDHSVDLGDRLDVEIPIVTDETPAVIDEASTLKAESPREVLEGATSIVTEETPEVGEMVDMPIAEETSVDDGVATTSHEMPVGTGETPIVFEETSAKDGLAEAEVTPIVTPLTEMTRDTLPEVPAKSISQDNLPQVVKIEDTPSKQISLDEPVNDPPSAIDVTHQEEPPETPTTDNSMGRAPVTVPLQTSPKKQSLVRGFGAAAFGGIANYALRALRRPVKDELNVSEPERQSLINEQQTVEEVNPVPEKWEAPAKSDLPSNVSTSETPTPSSVKNIDEPSYETLAAETPLPADDDLPTERVVSPATALDQDVLQAAAQLPLPTDEPESLRDTVQQEVPLTEPAKLTPTGLVRNEAALPTEHSILRRSSKKDKQRKRVSFADEVDFAPQDKLWAEPDGDGAALLHEEARTVPDEDVLHDAAQTPLPAEPEVEETLSDKPLSTDKGDVLKTAVHVPLSGESETGILRETAPKYVGLNAAADSEEAARDAAVNVPLPDESEAEGLGEADRDVYAAPEPVAQHEILHTAAHLPLPEESESLGQETASGYSDREALYAAALTPLPVESKSEATRELSALQHATPSVESEADACLLDNAAHTPLPEEDGKSVVDEFPSKPLGNEVLDTAVRVPLPAESENLGSEAASGYPEGEALNVAMHTPLPLESEAEDTREVALSAPEYVTLASEPEAEAHLSDTAAHVPLPEEDGRRVDNEPLRKPLPEDEVLDTAAHVPLPAEAESGIPREYAPSTLPTDLYDKSEARQILRSTDPSSNVDIPESLPTVDVPEKLSKKERRKKKKKSGKDLQLTQEAADRLSNMALEEAARVALPAERNEIVVEETPSTSAVTGQVPGEHDILASAMQTPLPDESDESAFMPLDHSATGHPSGGALEEASRVPLPAEREGTASEDIPSTAVGTGSLPTENDILAFATQTPPPHESAYLPLDQPTSGESRDLDTAVNVPLPEESNTRELDESVKIGSTLPPSGLDSAVNAPLPGESYTRELDEPGSTAEPTQEPSSLDWSLPAKRSKKDKRKDKKAAPVEPLTDPEPRELVREEPVAIGKKSKGKRKGKAGGTATTVEEGISESTAKIPAYEAAPATDTAAGLRSPPAEVPSESADFLHSAREDGPAAASVAASHDLLSPELAATVPLPESPRGLELEEWTHLEKMSEDQKGKTGGATEIEVRDLPLTDVSPAQPDDSQTLTRKDKLPWLAKRLKKDKKKTRKSGVSTPTEERAGIADAPLTVENPADVPVTVEGVDVPLSTGGISTEKAPMEVEPAEWALPARKSKKDKRKGRNSGLATPVDLPEAATDKEPFEEGVPTTAATTDRSLEDPVVESTSRELDDVSVQPTRDSSEQIATEESKPDTALPKDDTSPASTNIPTKKTKMGKKSAILPKSNDDGIHTTPAETPTQEPSEPILTGGTLVGEPLPATQPKKNEHNARKLGSPTVENAAVATVSFDSAEVATPTAGSPRIATPVASATAAANDFNVPENTEIFERGRHASDINAPEEVSIDSHTPEDYFSTMGDKKKKQGGDDSWVEPQPAAPIEAGDDEWAANPKKKKKGKKGSVYSTPAETPAAAEEAPVEIFPLSKKDKKKGKKGKLDESVYSTPVETPAQEAEEAWPVMGKKGKKKKGLTEPVAVVEAEPAEKAAVEAGEDELAVSKEKRKGKKGKGPVSAEEMPIKEAVQGQAELPEGIEEERVLVEESAEPTTIEPVDDSAITAQEPVLEQPQEKGLDTTIPPQDAGDEESSVTQKSKQKDRKSGFAMPVEEPNPEVSASIDEPIAEAVSEAPEVGEKVPSVDESARDPAQLSSEHVLAEKALDETAPETSSSRAPEADEEVWPVAGKKSKKDRRKDKKSGFATPVEEKSAAEVVPVVDPPEQLSERVSTEGALDSAALLETGPAQAPDAGEDEWAMTGKPSKKGKKKGRQSDMSTSMEEIKAPLDDAATADSQPHLEPVIDTSGPPTATPEVVSTQPEEAGEEDFFTPGKKSKREKKGRKNGISTLIGEVPKPLKDTPQPLPEPDVVTGVAEPPSDVDPISAQEAGQDTWDVSTPSRKDRKNKKKSGLSTAVIEQVTAPLEETSAVTEPEVSALEQPTEIVEPVSTLPHAQEPAEDEWAMPGRKGKKDKKKGRTSALATPAAEISDPMDEPASLDTPREIQPKEPFVREEAGALLELVSTEKVLDTAAALEAGENAATAVEPVLHQGERIVEEQPLELTAERTVDDGAASEAGPAPAQEAGDDIWDITDKKPKKGKKGRKSGLTTPMAEVSFVEPAEIPSTSEPPTATEQPLEPNTTERPLDTADAPEAGSVLGQETGDAGRDFSSKKSKKGKKKGKTSGPAMPRTEEAPTVVPPVGDMPPTDERLVDQSLELMPTAKDLDLTAAQEAGEDEWGVPGKTSKKGKKKGKNSDLATPVAEVATPMDVPAGEPVHVIEPIADVLPAAEHFVEPASEGIAGQTLEPTISGKGLDTNATAEIGPASAQEAGDDFWDSADKKSKKKKKGRQSGVVTPTAEKAPVVDVNPTGEMPTSTEENLPQAERGVPPSAELLEPTTTDKASDTADTLGTGPAAPQETGDEERGFADTKKGKKQSRKGGLATPMKKEGPVFDVPPTAEMPSAEERVVDGLPSVEPELSQGEHVATEQFLEPTTTDRALGTPSAPEAAPALGQEAGEDEWAMPGKKPKKGKKKGKTSGLATPVAEFATPLTEETPVIGVLPAGGEMPSSDERAVVPPLNEPLVESRPEGEHVIPPVSEEPLEPTSAERALDWATAPEAGPVSGQEAGDDDFAMAFKKSKKNKKGRKSGINTPLTDEAVVDPTEKPVDLMSAAKDLEPAAAQTQAPEAGGDEWTMDKKSKKGKKGRKSGLSTTIKEDVPVIGVSSTDQHAIVLPSGEPLAETLPRGEPIVSPATEQSLEPCTTERRLDPAAALEASPLSAQEIGDDELGVPSKESKKNKKGKKSGLSMPMTAEVPVLNVPPTVESATADVPLTSDNVGEISSVTEHPLEPTTTEKALDMAASLEGGPAAPQEAGDDEFVIPGKKSKKDKKKSMKSSITTPMTEEAPAAIIPPVVEVPLMHEHVVDPITEQPLEPMPTVEDPDPAPTSEAGPAQAQEAGDEKWGFTNKKSKKDKRKEKASGPATPITDISTPKEMVPAGESVPDVANVGEPSVEIPPTTERVVEPALESATEPILEPTATDKVLDSAAVLEADPVPSQEAGDDVFTVPGKKSKKDKRKGKKSGTSASLVEDAAMQAEEVPKIPPLDETVTHELSVGKHITDPTVETTRQSLEPVSAEQTLDTTAALEAGSIPSQAVGETIGEEEWGVPVKKSKKDKKGKRSGMATPVEVTTPLAKPQVVEHAPSLGEPTVEPGTKEVQETNAPLDLGLDKEPPVTAAAPQVNTPLSEDPWEVPTKKSKKDKRKGKQGATAEESVYTTPAETPIKEVSTPSEQIPQDTEPSGATVGKKGKKKKGKRSGLAEAFTPAEETPAENMPASEPVDASVEARDYFWPMHAGESATDDREVPEHVAPPADIHAPPSNELPEPTPLDKDIEPLPQHTVPEAAPIEQDRDASVTKSKKNKRKGKKELEELAPLAAAAAAAASVTVGHSHHKEETPRDEVPEHPVPARDYDDKLPQHDTSMWPEEGDYFSAKPAPELCVEKFDVEPMSTAVLPPSRTAEDDREGRAFGEGDVSMLDAPPVRGVDEPLPDRDVATTPVEAGKEVWGVENKKGKKKGKKGQILMSDIPPPKEQAAAEPLPAQDVVPTPGEDWGAPTKKGKKKGKKGMPMHSAEVLPVDKDALPVQKDVMPIAEQAPIVATEQLPALEVAAEQLPPQDVVATPAAPAEADADVWDMPTTKKGKKGKKVLTAPETYAEPVAEPVQAPMKNVRDMPEQHPTESLPVTESVPAQPDESAWEPPVKKGKKGKKKALETPVVAAAETPQVDYFSSKPLPAEETLSTGKRKADLPTPEEIRSDQTFTEPSKRAKKDRRKKTVFDDVETPEVPVEREREMGAGDVGRDELRHADKGGVEPLPTDKGRAEVHPIDEDKTTIDRGIQDDRVPTNLSGSKFDPASVLSDPTFTRKSPPTVGEGDPGEVTETTRWRAKKSPPRDFDSTVALGLEGSGFDPAILEEVKSTPATHKDPDEPEFLPTKKRSKPALASEPTWGFDALKDEAPRSPLDPSTQNGTSFQEPSARLGTPDPTKRDAISRGASPSLRVMSRTDLYGDFGAARSEAGSVKTIPVEPPPTPPANDDEVMADVYQGYGDATVSTSPTRPPSARKRQSMHIGDLESRIDQLVAENRALQEGRADGHLREALEESEYAMRKKDAEVHRLQALLEPLQDELARLREINSGLTNANRELVDDMNGRYTSLERDHAYANEQWQRAVEELERVRGEHGRLSAGMEAAIQARIATALADKNAEIHRLREELDAASEQVRALEAEIRASRKADYLTVRDEDYFDVACQKLCQHVQQWVLRFSKMSDNRICRLSQDVGNDKVEARLDNAVLDGSDVDRLLIDRVRRRDAFMSVVMTMVWEYVFTRYLFGMDRDQRQKLKTLEKQLAEIGPPRAVAQWRATTLTLLSKRPEFARQCALDTQAVAEEIFDLLCMLLPPPSQAQRQLLASLVKVVGVAVNLSIEMRTQRAEYIMLPPLQPEYDTNGELVRFVHFNAALMNERSGAFSSNQELQKSRAVVKVVLFPLVVKKGDDSGEGDEEIVICPAQVLVQNDQPRKRMARVLSGERNSKQSLISTPPGSLR